MLRFWTLIVLGACSSPISNVHDGGGAADTDAEVTRRDAGVDSRSLEASACNDIVPLHVAMQEGMPAHVLADVSDEDGVTKALVLDTGSSTTFVATRRGTPDPTRDAATFTVGCTSVRVDGRPFPSPVRVDGLVPVGTLGADALLLGTTELDLVARHLLRHARGVSVPGADGFAALPFENIQGHIIVTVTVGGRPLRLMFDTGSPHLMELHAQGQPGDAPIEVQDANGTVLTFFLGKTDITLGNETFSIPLFRAPSFPYFEETVRILGGNIHGLIGLSAFGTRRQVIDPEAGKVLVGSSR